MKIKGRINEIAAGSYYPHLTLSENWASTYTFGEYKSFKLAKAAAERLAKKLGLEIEWKK